MSFKQYLRDEVTKGLDETYKADAAWAKNHPGRGYYDVHLSTIEQHEMAAPLFRRYLAKGGLKVLESGCGSGRWMAYFDKLGNQAYGVDDSWGPLLLAREHDPDMRLVRSNALVTPYADNTFDAALSAYVAEHFQEGPEVLFREIHRVLKPGGLLFVVVPYNNTFRRFFVNPLLMALWQIWKWRGKGLEFTEFRYIQPEMEGFPAPHRLRHRRGAAGRLLPAVGEGSVLRRVRHRLLLQLRAQAAVRIRSGGPRHRQGAAQRQPLVRGGRHLLRRPRPQVNHYHGFHGS
jgi:ubiquinone/menaquinone biosynthesis C-methylase UbiE